MEKDDLKKELESLFVSTKEGQKFKEYYETPILFDVIDMYRYEDASTNFLASFLKNKDSYFDLGNEPLLKFIDLLIEKGKGKLKGDFSNIKTLSKIDIDISIRPKLNHSKRHPDMVITINKNEKLNKNNKYFILLEAKLSSDETSEKQCEDYYNNAKEKENEYPNMAFVYLSLLEDPIISDEEHYVKITYQDLIDKLYEPFLDELKEKNKKLNEILEEYLKSFSRLVKTGYNYIGKRLERPITNKGEILAKDLYQKDKDKIEKIISSINKTDINSDDYQEQFLFRMLLIILYKKERLSEELEEKIRKLFAGNEHYELRINNSSLTERLKQAGINIRKTSITEFTKIAPTIFFLLLNSGKSKDEINNIIGNKYGKYRLIYDINDFDNQRFTENQKNYYDSLQVNNNKYKVLVSYSDEEMKILVDGLQKSGLFPIKDIEIWDKKKSIPKFNRNNSNYTTT